MVDMERTRELVERLQVQAQSAVGEALIAVQGWVPERAEEGAHILTITNRAIYRKPDPRLRQRTEREQAYSVRNVWYC